MSNRQSRAEQLADDLYEQARSHLQDGGASLQEVSLELVDDDELLAGRELVRQGRATMKGNIITIGFDLLPPWIRDLPR